MEARQLRSLRREVACLPCKLWCLRNPLRRGNRLGWEGEGNSKLDTEKLVNFLGHIPKDLMNSAMIHPILRPERPS